MTDNNTALKKAGLKVTLPRLKILEVLQEPDNHHVSAEDLYKRLKSVFELTQQHHHDHLICLDCGKVIEFSDDSIEARQREIAAKHGIRSALKATAAKTSTRTMTRLNKCKSFEEPTARLAFLYPPLSCRLMLI